MLQGLLGSGSGEEETLEIYWACQLSILFLIIFSQSYPKYSYLTMCSLTSLCLTLYKTLMNTKILKFCHNNNLNVVDDEIRKITVKDGGFGVPNVNTFWKSIRMSWLRRSIGSESTWFKLHQRF